MGYYSRRRRSAADDSFFFGILEIANMFGPKGALVTGATSFGVFFLFVPFVLTHWAESKRASAVTAGAKLSGQVMEQLLTNLLTPLSRWFGAGLLVCCFGIAVWKLLTNKLGSSENSRKAGIPHLRTASQPAQRYKPRDLMTPAEKKFFRLLQQAIPEVHVCPQVSMGAIMESTSNANSSNRRERRQAQSDWATVRANRIDFVLIDEDQDVVGIVELDDKSHRGREDKDADRDKRTAEAGYVTVRVSWENGKLPTVDALRERLAEELGAEEI